MISKWVAAEMQTLDLGDKRNNARALHLMSALAAQPACSIPVACGSKSQAKAAYRHLDLDVDAQRWLAAHYQSTAERAGAYPFVYALSDTTELEFAVDAEGAGPLDSSFCRGLKAHHVLAVSPDGLPLGLVDQQVWARDAEEIGKRHTRRSRAPKEKESWKWMSAAEAAEERLPKGVGVVYVADREADVYSVLAAERRPGMEFLIRAAHNRRLKDSEYRTLMEAVEGAPVLGNRTLTVPRTKTWPEREATLEIRSAPVTLLPPKNGTNGKDLGPVRTTVVLAREAGEVPAGVKRLEWLLLTDRVVGSLEEALWCVNGYALRWRVERFHFTLKSGTSVEKLQLETADRLKRALAIYSIIAWRLLSLTYLARVEPDAPCTQVLEEDEWKALVLMQPAKRGVKPALVPPSIREAVRQIAAWGGFLGRKGDGEPGVKSLWIGWRRFMDYTDAYRRLRQDVGNG